MNEKFSQRLGRLIPGGGREGAPRLGEALLAECLITQEQLDVALEDQARKGFRLGYHLVKRGALSENQLGDFLARRFGVPSLDPALLQVDAQLCEDISHDFLKRHEVLPVSRTQNTLTLVMADPTDQEAVHQLQERLGLQVNPVVAPQSSVRKLLADYLALENIRDQAEGEDARALAHFFTHLKDYRFQEVLGVGGFGMVCKCWQVSLDRPVAIKTLNSRISRMPGMIERFRREGKIIAKLNHPNIIQVFELGEAHGHIFIVMEYFDGQPLDSFCEGLDLVEKMGCLSAICDALHYASGKGVVHRDVKPANMLAGRNGDVKLLDFGVAYHEQPADERMTQANIVLGTPRYMAPECFDSAHDSSTRSDIFAMAVVTYELLTGTRLDRNDIRPAHKIDPSIPLLISKTLLKGLESDPARRLSSFDLFRRALHHSREHLLMGHAAPGALTMPTPAAPLPRPDSGPVVAGDQPVDTDSAIQQIYEEKRILRDEGRNLRVLHAHHRQMDRDVIIKQLPWDQVEEKFTEKLTALRHPAVGQLLGATRESGVVTLVLEYCPGASLADRMAAGPVAGRLFAQWSEQLVQGLHAAAERGIPHGNLHPGNVLFDEKDQLKIVDFCQGGPRTKDFARFSRPELRRAWDRDLYGLGVLWFEMLSGERYRGAKSPEQNFQLLHENKNLAFHLKVPLARLWGIQRYGPRHKNYASLLSDLQMIREKEERRGD